MALASTYLRHPRQPVTENLQRRISFEDRRAIADENNPTRSLALKLGLLFTFIELTRFHELITMVVHVNLYLLYVVSIPAYAALIAAGGLQRTWQSPQSRYWIGVGLWMMISVPFSYWIMFSLGVVRDYFRTEIVVLFMLAGLVLTWTEVERLMKVLAWAAVVNILVGRLFQHDLDGRLDLSGGSLADPNDYAAILILMLPFLLLVVITPGRKLLAKAMAALFIAAGLYLILSTGSRGALVGLMVGLSYCLWRANMIQRIASVAAAGILGVSLMAVLPATTKERLATTFTDSAATDASVRESAIGSKEARTYLLKRSIAVAFEHPLLGVGLGQFQNYEGVTAREAGRQGNWHETHNTYTQIASEAGIPGFLLLAGGVIATFRLLSRTYRKAREMPATLQNEKICRTCFAVMLSLLSFSVTVFFLSMAYRCYLPALTGMTIAIARAAEREWTAASKPEPAPSVRFA